MSKNFTFLILFILVSQAMYAQDYVEVSVGPSYSNQAYYSLIDNEVTTLDNQSWDLGFMMGDGEAGVLINESTDAVFSGEVPELKLLITYDEDFSITVDPEILTDSLYNDESNWQNGAFNRVSEEGNTNDYGWGFYNEGTGIIEGSWVFALKLRDNTWKKVKIESLEDGIFTMKYADLDGANETIVTIDKADYDSPMAYFSFATETTTASPANWDIVFQRYLSALDAGGTIVLYPTVGGLSAPGIEVAEVRDVVPVDASFADHVDSLKIENDIIGHDWKYFDLGAFQWVVETNRVYFLKMTDNQIWKLNFVDFAGSGSGSMVFEKTNLGILLAINNPESNFEAANVFPNPIESQFTLSFTLKQARNNMQLSLVNAIGQTVWNGMADATAGLNVLNLKAPKLTPGYYQLVVGNGDDLWTTSVLLK